MRSLNSVSVSVVSLVMLAGTAFSQETIVIQPGVAPQQQPGGYKPLPPQRVMPEPGSERLSNDARFMEAYARAGSPKLLFVAGGTDARSASLAQGLGARLEDLFRDGTISVVNAPAAGLREGRGREVLERNDEHAAARIAANDVGGADVVISLEAQPDALGGGRQTVTYSAVNLRTSTTIDRWTFDLLPDPATGAMDRERLGEYARALGRRITREFERSFAGSGAFTRYTLRIVGEFDEDALLDLREGLDDMPGTRRGSATLRDEGLSSGGKLTTFELLSGLDTLSMRQALRNVAAERLGATAQVLSATGSTIDVRLTPLGLSARELALSGGPQTSRNAGERTRLQSAYARANRPSIAVVISRAAAADVPLLSVTGEPISVGDTTNVVVADRVGSVGGGLDPRDPVSQARDLHREQEQRQQRADQQQSDSVQLESRVLERLTTLGLMLKDVAAAPAEASPAAGSVVGDRAYALGLAKAVDAQVVVTGVSRVTRVAPGRAGAGSPLRVEVALRAIRVSDGVVLTASSASKDVQNANMTLEQAYDDVTAQLVGRLAAGLTDVWER